MVGAVFLHLSGTTPLPKCKATHRPHFTFYQTGCDLFLKGYSSIPFVVLANFFSFHICDQRKEEQALEKIKTLIPNKLRFEKIVSEYEKRATREAEFAKAVDCLDACIRNINDDTKSNNDGFTEVLIRNKYLPHVSKFDITKELFEHLIHRLQVLNKL